MPWTDVLDELVDDPKKFLACWWQNEPCIHRASDGGKRAAELLSLDAAERIISNPAVRPPYVEVYSSSKAIRERTFTRKSHKKSLVVQDTMNVDVVASLFEDGATIVINQPDDLVTKVRQFSDALQDRFGAPAHAIAFITPPNTPGMDIHRDAFEGFILQTSGRKRWLVYEREHPLSQTPSGLREDPDRKLLLDVVLAPGDCLYIPWGSPHRGIAEEGVSCHLTFMVHPPSWQTFLREQADAAIPEWASDTLAPKWDEPSNEQMVQRATDEVLRSLELADPMDALRRWEDDSHANGKARRSLLHQQLEADVIGPSSTVSAAFVAGDVTDRDEARESYISDCNGKVVSIPRQAAAIMRALAETGTSQEIRILQSQSELDSSKVLQLVKALVRHGLIEVTG